MQQFHYLAIYIFLKHLQGLEGKLVSKSLNKIHQGQKIDLLEISFLRKARDERMQLQVDYITELRWKNPAYTVACQPHPPGTSPVPCNSNQMECSSVFLVKYLSKMCGQLQRHGMDKEDFCHILRHTKSQQKNELQSSVRTAKNTAGESLSWLSEKMLGFTAPQQHSHMECSTN